MLEVTGLSAAYAGAGTSLTSVDLEVRPGEVVTVLGSNGAGKSTLLRALSKTLMMHTGKITGGTIHWQGKDVTKASSAKMVQHGIVQCPEGRGIFANLTVHENLKVGSFALGRRAAKSRAEQSYEAFPDLVRFRRTPAGLLSGGQQQMLAVARALMVQPALLLLDEPSLGLAPKIVAQIGEIVANLKERGTSVLLVEQNAAMALSVADRAYVLEMGSVLTSGDAAALAQDDTIAQLYLGAGGDDQPMVPMKSEGS